ncbi:MAG: cysteine hydrolase [Vicinamibacterales bacterium]
MSTPTNITYDEWKTGVLSKIDPARTAVVVIDLQRDFCSTDGALAGFGSDVSPNMAVADRIERFLPQVRELVGLVAFFQLVYDPAAMSESQKERLIRDGKPVICRPGSSGCELVFRPDRRDYVFTKHRYSAFSNPQFQTLLRDRQVTTVAVAGVDTHICVEGSVRHGYDLGFRMIVISDLVSTRQSEFTRHENSLALCERYFGLTVESAAFRNTCEANRKALEVASIVNE